MKNCPKCAEEVQDAAKVCRHCGHKFSKPWEGIGCFGAIVLAIVVAIAANEDISSEQEQVAASKPVMDVKECEGTIDKAAKAGIVRQRPDVNRVNVDEVAWAVLPADAKKGVLLSVLCAVTEGGRLNPQTTPSPTATEAGSV